LTTEGKKFLKPFADLTVSRKSYSRRMGLQMKVLGETEQPNSGIADGLLESLPSRSLLLDIDSVTE